MQNKIAATLLSAVMFFAPVLSYGAQEVDKTKMSKAHRKAYDAALALYIDEGDGPRFTCSTTVVGKNGGAYALLTAGHCIAGDGQADGAKFYVTEEIVDKPVLQPVTVVRNENDDKYDFAILELDTAKDYPVMSIENRIPDVEDKVYTVNYSLGLAKQVALGEVASAPITKGAADGRACDNSCVGRYLVHLFNGPGSSGASVIDEKTNTIVGVVELGWNGATVGTGVETTASLVEWLALPASAIPKA